MTIEYICKGCMAGPCRAIVPDDGGPAPDCCLYGDGTVDWTEVEPDDQKNMDGATEAVVYSGERTDDGRLLVGFDLGKTKRHVQIGNRWLLCRLKDQGGEG